MCQILVLAIRIKEFLNGEEFSTLTLGENAPGNFNSGQQYAIAPIQLQCTRGFRSFAFFKSGSEACL